MKLSLEQQAIVDAIIGGANVICDAVAGAGKTTTILGAAVAYAERFASPVLQMTYNSALKLEVRKKAAALGLSSLIVHSYHSLAVKYYSASAYTDEGVIRVLSEDMPLRDDCAISRFQLFIIDEAQDMTPLYFRLMQKFIRDCGLDQFAALTSTRMPDNDAEAPALQFAIFGDKYQGIYGFMGADISYLTEAGRHWGRQFQYLQMRRTYRCRGRICNYINSEVLGEERLVSAYEPETGCHKVDFWGSSIFESAALVASDIQTYIRAGCKPEDIFILAPSIRKNTPLRALERELVKLGIPVFYPNSDDGVLDLELMQHKIVFSSFHQSKGRERATVFIYGCDDDYFRYYARELYAAGRVNECPPAIYVAMTRAKQHLFIVRDPKQQPLPFLQSERGKIASDEPNTLPPKPLPVTDRPVTDLTRHLSSTKLEQLLPLIDRGIARVHAPEDGAKPLGRIRISHRGLGADKMLTEDVSCYTGLVIQNFVTGLTPSDVSIKDALAAAVVNCSESECLDHQKTVIKSFDWLSSEVLERAREVFNARVEVAFMTEVVLVRGIIIGRVDVAAVASDGPIWELKSTSSLQIEHRLQALLYSYLSGRECRLLNLLSGEEWRVTAAADLEAIVAILLASF